VRQERSALQHNEATCRSDSARLLAGKDDSTMSVNRFWKAASPICGVVADVAPGGAHITKPVLQSPSEFKDDTESAVPRVASIARRRNSGRIMIAGSVAGEVLTAKNLRGKLK
jgi:hypothetical protein